MKIDVFKLEIALGNEAMQTVEDVASRLERTAELMRRLDRMADIGIFDLNGNVVGRTALVKRRV